MHLSPGSLAGPSLPCSCGHVAASGRQLLWVLKEVMVDSQEAQRRGVGQKQRGAEAQPACKQRAGRVPGSRLEGGGGITVQALSQRVNGTLKAAQNSRAQTLGTAFPHHPPTHPPTRPPTEHVQRRDPGIPKDARKPGAAAPGSDDLAAAVVGGQGQAGGLAQPALQWEDGHAKRSLCAQPAEAY